jgi:L-alanine-DL-glutamate epimerase-like enolase superfamily enzyme
MTRITGIRTWACRVPLDHPIRFRWNTITHRDCTVVEVTTDSGVTGAAIGLSRGAPLDVVISDMLSSHVVGFDAMDTARFQSAAHRAHSFHDQTGMLAMARSLVDLALWDIRGKVLGAPLWKLLGGGGLQNAPVLLVEGYETAGETDRQFAERLAARWDEGFTAVKIEAAAYDDPRQLDARLTMLRSLTGDDLDIVVDVNGAWRSVREAIDAIHAIDGTRIAWVEDPFPHENLAAVGELRSRVDVPIGTGDDVTEPRALMTLMVNGSVDVIRVDATTLGGVQATSDVLGVARAHGIAASGHAHTATHQHFTFAWPEQMHYVEAFPDDRPWEPSYKLTTSSVYSRVVDGRLAPPQEPGLGFELALDRVDAWSHRRFEVKP